MKNVCVITGGGSGMGLEAAKFMPKEKIIVLSGRTEKKLEKAVQELTELGYTAYLKTCAHPAAKASVSWLICRKPRRSEKRINSAGLSPAMASERSFA